MKKLLNIAIISVLLHATICAMEEDRSKYRTYTKNQHCDFNINDNNAQPLKAALIVGGLAGAAQPFINKLDHDSYTHIIAQGFLKGLIEGLCNLYKILHRNGNN